MILNFGAEPSDTQKKFLLARKKNVAFGGARGGGKSWAVRTKAKLAALKYPGIKILIVRKTYPELIANHIDTMRAECFKIAKYNSTNRKFTFFNSSTIKFDYCQNDGDLSHFQGTEYDLIFIDEATNLTEHQIKVIKATLRSVNRFPKRLYLTCNPGGPGHAYIKRVFIDKKFKSGENPDEYEFIQSLVTDNKVLMEVQPDYIEQLEELPEKLKQGWLYGRWDIFEGQVFEEFTDDPEHYIDRQWTHVVEPFEIPSWWPIYRGFDWGYAKPFSVGWYAFDDEGVCYRIKEFYGCSKEENTGLKWDIATVARKIHEIETNDRMLKDRQIIGIADPAIFAENGGAAISDTMAEHQVYFNKADNERLAGKMQCHYRLAFDENGHSMFYVFNTCKEFIRTIPALIYSETKVEDVNTDMEDHIYDEWRYVMMQQKIQGREPVVKNIPDLGTVEDPLDMIRDRLKQRRSS